MSLSSGSSTTVCHLCGENSRFIHHDLHFGTIKSFCTDCLLHLHPRSFCPICFEVYKDPDTLTSDVVLLCGCLSFTHITCIASPPNSSYFCAMCANGYSVLPVLREMNEGKEIDKKAARALLAACEISASSMRKAAVAATKDAEAKVKDVISAKEMATKAAEHYNDLISKKD